LEDSYKQKGRRRRLVQALEQKGITDENVLKAILEIPRHFFFPSDFLDDAYVDKAFPIGSGQTISQPYTVAFQTQLLKIKKGAKVLEIGTGSGYQAAILSAMGAEVYSVERMEDLYRSTVELFRLLKLPIHCFLGDGSKGLTQHQPYDAIIVTAAGGKLAENLRNQLIDGGRLVLPVGNHDIQKMVLIERLVENKYQRSEHGDFKFVPLLGKHGLNA
jgi:protein-L-isoaspartate(D-aspartate) O-methyltransferase